MAERKLASGQKFVVSSREHGRWQDAGKDVAENPRALSVPDDEGDSQDDLILVKNTTGRDLPRFSVLGLRSPMQSPTYTPQAAIQFKNNQMIKGEEPSSTTSGRFCVLQEPARNNTWVRGKVSGTTQCLLKVNSITDEFADVETSSSVSDKTRYLTTGASGSAQLMYAPEVTGEQLGIVRLGNKSGRWFNDSITGLNNGGFTAGSSGSSVFSGFDSIGGTVTHFELDGDGYLVIKKAQVNPQIFGVLYFSVPFERNHWIRVECNLQQFSGGVWSDIGQNVYKMSAWPDVGTLSSSGAIDLYTLTLWSVYGATATSVANGSKIRMEIKTYYSGTAPVITVTGIFNAVHQ